MARIRTIKPEFPHSESMGRVSREARLLFVLLWTLADDSGRLRGTSRMLASLLYPYDNDAAAHIDAWVADLEMEGCIVRYAVDGASYVQIRNWSKHQKIDKPTPSKLPAFVEASPNPRESSRGLVGGLDLDLEGKGRDLPCFVPSVAGGVRTPVPLPPDPEKEGRKEAVDSLLQNLSSSKRGL